MSRELLVVSYSGGIQKCRTVGGLARDHGYDVTMVTTEVAPELRAELPENVEVTEVPDPKPISVYRPFWVWKAHQTVSRILAKRDIDVVLSWQVPIASHLVAALVTRSRRVYWVAHFGDPWIGNPYATGLIRKVLYFERLERYIVDSADALTFPTDRMREMYEVRHGIQTGKAYTVPNNVDPEEIRRIEPKTHIRDCGDNEPESILRLVHTGSFYGPRTPEPFFVAIDRLDAEVRDRISVILVGDMNEYEGSVEEYGVDDVVDAIGRVPKNEALAYAKGSDALILIDAPVENSPFLATKLVEYMFMDRPILGITPDSGTAADVIRETSTGVVTPPDDPKQISRVIQEFEGDKRDGVLSVDPDEAARQRYTSEAAVGELAGILDQSLSE